MASDWTPRPPQPIGSDTAHSTGKLSPDPPPESMHRSGNWTPPAAPGEKAGPGQWSTDEVIPPPHAHRPPRS